MGFLSGAFGSRPDNWGMKSAKPWLQGAMTRYNDWLENAYGPEARMRSKGQFTSDAYKQMGNANAVYGGSLASRGITPSGANIGQSRLNTAIAQNNLNVEDQYNSAYGNALMNLFGLGQNISGLSTPGSAGWATKLANIYGTIKGMG